MSRQSGFTLIELMIVIAIIAIIAAIAIPNLLASRLNANETAAIATLRNIISAQAQFQATALADTNANGVGEYGFFGEMSCAGARRSRCRRSRPRSGPRRRKASCHGADTCSSSPCPTRPATRSRWPTSVTSNPSSRSTRGRAMRGRCRIATRETGSSASTRRATAAAAYALGGSTDTITGVLATAVTGRDGNFWKTVG